ncbi:MAG: hypothetical protein ACKVJU_21865 [Verrucomicrobiales bacterium]
MKLSIHFLIAVIATTSFLTAGDYEPKLFKSVELIYEDDFSGGTLNTDYWQKRQGTTWAVKDGVLKGSQSPKAFQDKMIVKGDKAHAGFKPVIWLEKVPENLVVLFRVRFDSKNYQGKFPLIDIGHHINTLSFAEKRTTLILKDAEKPILLEEKFLPLNTWIDVTIELKKGVLFLKMGDKTHTFEDPSINMVDQQQIDFKGANFCEIQIDNVKVYKGIE